MKRIIIVLILGLMMGCGERPNANEIRLKAEIVELQQKLDASREETKLVMGISDTWKSIAEQCSSQLDSNSRFLNEANRRLGKIIKDSK